MTKKSKKSAKTLSLSEFQATGGSRPQPRNALPKGPGEQPTRSYNNNRRGGERRGYGDSERSRADDSNQWRRKGGDGPPRRNNNSYGFDNRDNNRERKGFDRGGDRGDRMDNRRERRRDDDSRGGDRGDQVFSRADFGSKKQTGSPYGGGDRSFGGGDRRRNSGFRDRSDRSGGMGGGFNNRSRDDRSSDNLDMDRSNWGQRKVAIKPMGRGGRNPRSSFMDKRGEFDGSGKGFGAQLVADCFVPLEQNDDRRVTYANNKKPRMMTAWNQPVHQKSEEQIQKERERDEEKKRKEETERKTREEIQRKKEAERKKKEEEEKKMASERKRKEEERKRLEEMDEAVTTMMRSNEDVVQLTADQCEIVLPGLKCDQNEAERIGVGVGMSVHANIIGMNDAISCLPKEHHDLILASMFQTIVKRVGESTFLRQLDDNQVNFDEIVQNADVFEKLIKEYSLTCLLESEESDNLDPAFAEHINLKDLGLLVGENPVSSSQRQRIFKYICDEFFAHRDVEKPAEFFDDVQLFYKITNDEKHVHTFLDVLTESWFENERPLILVGLFDHLIRTDIAPAHLVSEWNMRSEIEAKMYALLCKEDYHFKVENEVFEGEDFSSWLAQIDEIYPEPEEEEEDWGEHGV